MTNDEYHRDTTRISKSGLDKINRSPYHYWEAYLNPAAQEREETKAMFTGSFIHCAIFERDEFSKRYITVPPTAPKRPSVTQLKAKNPSDDTLKAIAWWSEFNSVHAGKLQLTTEQYNQSQRMGDAVHRHPAAGYIVNLPGQHEHTLQFTEPFTGAPCKMRADFLPDPIPFIVDLKTTENASPEGFGRSVGNYRYHVQSAFYVDGHEYATGEKKDGFLFIAVEKEPPYAVAVYDTTKLVMDIGREKYIENCQTYVDCLRSGVWPAYSDDILPLSMPGWFFKQ